MEENGAFGATMARYFGAERSVVVSHSLQLDSAFAITHLRCDGQGSGLTSPIPRERALLVAYQFIPLASHELWIAGRRQLVRPYARGAVSAVDLDSEPVACLDSPYQALQFYLPHRALAEFAAADECRVLTELHLPHGTLDPVLEHIAHVARYLTLNPDQATGALLDALMRTVVIRLTQQYGHQPAPLSCRGGLAPWQERRVKELIDAHLDSQLTLAQMARQCGLSLSHFARAFRRSTGEAPYRWVRRRRIERAEHLLQTSRLSLSEIALACGYADQSHLCKAFKMATGASPSMWRRAMPMKAGPDEPSPDSR